MYTGDNPVALQSQEWLVDALFELMKTTPYDRITVRDLCRKADLSRQTFYNCFDEKDDVVRLILRNWYYQMREEIFEKEEVDPLKITLTFATIFQRYHQPMKVLLDQHLNSIIAEEIGAFMSDLQPRVTSSYGTPHLDTYGVAFLNGAITALLLHWFQDPDPISPEELAAFMVQVLSGNYYEL